MIVAEVEAKVMVLQLVPFLRSNVLLNGMGSCTIFYNIIFALIKDEYANLS